MKILHLSMAVELEKFIGSLVGTAVGDSIAVSYTHLTLPTN